jgi:acyl carrier protein
MVFEKVKAMLSEQLNVDAALITMDSNIVADLHADSLDVVEMLISLEDNFGIQVPDEVANELVTVSAIVKFVENAKK